MGTAYEIRAGDCLSSIAFERGFYWQTIWNHSDNADLKQLRKSPNILNPGDIVVLPDLTPKEQTAGTEVRHRFRLKGVPVKLRLRVLRPPKPPETAATQATSSTPRNGKDHAVEDPEPTPLAPDEPYANVAYTLEIEGCLLQDSTDSNGMILCSIPPNAKTGRLILEPGTPQESILPLQLAYLAPISELSGVKHRLANLGLGCGDFSSEPTPEFEASLRAFQAQQGVEVTGELDNATREKLSQIHGS